MIDKKLKNLNILSFNWHEPYLCLLAKAEHRFTIVEPEVQKGVTMRWRHELRSVPGNITLMDKEAALSQLESGAFDFAICQNVKDLIFIKDFSLPKLLVFHNKLTTEIILGENKVDRKEYLTSLNNFLKNVTLIFISEAKRKDWGLEGTIINPGIDQQEYEDYEGDIQKVLRVGNMIKERDLMMGYTLQEEILKGIPNTLLGQNPAIPESRISKSWEDLKACYKSYRVFLNTTVNQYEDGYNLAMLEAMAAGMPVISSANDSSPIIDGENGFISNDIHYLREKIKLLLSNRDEAKRIGLNGRQSIKEKFSLAKFTEKWETAITNSVLEFVSHASSTAKKQTENQEISNIIGFGFVEFHKGNIKKAADYFKQALDQLPLHDKAILGEGLCLWKQGEKEKGFQKYCDSLNINIENIEALLNLIEAAGDLNYYNEAEKYVREYITLHPSNLKILFKLAEIQFALGKMDEARDHLNKIFIFEPRNEDAIKLMKKIEK